MNRWRFWKKKGKKRGPINVVVMRDSTEKEMKTLCNSLNNMGVKNIVINKPIHGVFALDAEEK